MDSELTVNHLLSAEKLLNKLPSNVYCHNIDHTVLACNEAQAIDLNYSNPSDLIGLHLSQWASGADLDNVIKNNNKVISTGMPLICEEVRHDENNNRIFYISYKAPLRNKHNKIIGICGTSININILKEKELELLSSYENIEIGLENLMASLPGHVYWKDLNRKYIGCNLLQARSLGFDSPADIIGKRDEDLYPVIIAGHHKMIDDRIIHTGKEEELEETAILADKKEHTFLSHKKPLKNKKRETVGLLGISFDITERKKTEAALVKAKQDVEQASLAKTTFIRNMEHDIRTPFNGICGLTEILLSQEKDPSKIELLNDIKNCADELLKYCNEIIDFSHVESQSVPITDKCFNPHDLVDNILSIENVSAVIKSLKIQSHIDSNVPKALKGDKYRLQRILINLVSNAIKFTNKGHIKLDVSLIDLDPNKKRAIISFSVEDTGIGIPDDKQISIFEKFTKIAPSNEGIHKGQGLGLSIVKQFITEMGGDIHIKSTFGEGSTFTVVLPFDLPLTDKFAD